MSSLGKKLSSLSIIIVNWNAGQQLRSCILSIVNTNFDGVDLCEVVVVDNGSIDNSLDGVGELELNIKIIRNFLNKGFAAACNQGAQVSNAEYLLFLNPDTVMFENSLTKTLEFMEREENARVGICGIKLLDENGQFSTSCARFPSVRIFFGSATGLSKLLPSIFPPHLLTAKECELSDVVDQVIGAFFLVRKSVYDKLKGFDEQFFVYFEEVDFALRAKKIGFDSYYMSGVSAYHKGGGCTDAIKATRLFYSLRSRFQYGKKHFSVINNIALFVITIFIEFSTRVALAIYRKSFSQLRETVKGYKKLFAYWING